MSCAWKWVVNRDTQQVILTVGSPGLTMVTDTTIESFFSLVDALVQFKGNFAKDDLNPKAAVQEFERIIGNKQGERYIVHDGHSGYDWPDPICDTRLWDFCDMLRPEDRVYASEMWEGAWLGKRLQDNPNFIRFQQSIDPSQWTFVKANHTYSPPVPFPMVEYADIVTPRGTIRVMHGHQFDPNANAAWKRSLYGLAPAVAGIWLGTPWQKKMHANSKWQWQNGIVWGRGVQYLETHPEIVMLHLGHTHDSRFVISPLAGQMVFGTGSICEDGVISRVRDDGFVELLRHDPELRKYVPVKR